MCDSAESVLFHFFQPGCTVFAVFLRRGLFVIGFLHISCCVSGFLELPPGAIKDDETVGQCSQVYFVSECQDKGGMYLLCLSCGVYGVCVTSFLWLLYVIYCTNYCTSGNGDCSPR